MTARQQHALTRVAEYLRYKGGLRASASEIGVSRAVLGSLAHAGLLSVSTQEEGARGERRVRYQLYELTDAGRAAL